MSTMVSTVERARGCWKEILPRLGVTAAFLQNRHGPCPICGGKDRFRFDDKRGEGTYYCGQCGAGTAIILLRKFHGWTHKQACDEVDRVIGTDQRPAPEAKPRCNDGDAKIRDTERVLREASAPDVVQAYLKARGLSVASDVLRGHRSLGYFDADRRLVGRFAAVVAPIITADGKLVSAHRIWRQADVGDDRKKPMPIPFKGALNGAAVRLHEPDDVVGVAEGIETALAAFEIFGIPTWAGLTAHGLETFVPPLNVNRVHIFGDNDATFTGQAAAHALAKRLAIGGIQVTVNIPDTTNTDWLDVLNERARS